MENSTSRHTPPQFHPLSLARAVWKRKLLVTFCFVALSATGIWIAHTLPAVYKAEALILVDPQKVPERFVESTVTEDLQERLSTISQEIQSTPRLQAIIDELHLYPEARKQYARERIIEMMRKDIEVKVEKGRAFRITYQAPDPKTAATVVARMTDLYIEQNLKSRETQAAGTTEFLETQLSDAKVSLEKLERALSQYKVAHNGELPEQEMTLNGTLGRLQLELQGNQDAANRAQQDRMILQDQLAAGEATEAALKRSGQTNTSASGTGDPQAAVDPALAQLEQQYTDLRDRYTDAHPDVKALKQKIDSVKRAKAVAVVPDMSGAADHSHGTPAANSSVPVAVWSELMATRERITTLKSQLEQINRNLDQLAKDRVQILKSTGEYEARIAQLPLREQEMTGLMRDYQISRNNYQSLLDKKLAAEMAGDLERRQKAERFRILDPAKAPDVPFKPKRGVLYVASVIAGLLISVGIAIVLEIQQGVFLGYWELPKEVPVLGLIPDIALRNASVTDAELKTLTPQNLKHPVAVA